MKAVHSSVPVAGHTHSFYRYPARFSPQFARAAIDFFSRPGDTVLDPFMGGGTAAVEALVSGRRFVGCDINSLAAFVTRVKTTPLTKPDADLLAAWAKNLSSRIDLRSDHPSHLAWEVYQRHVPWWIRKTLEMALDTLDELPKPRQRRFARCTLLRTAQWGLDARQDIPGSGLFLKQHRLHVADMLESILAFGSAVKASFSQIPHESCCQRRVLHRSAVGLATDGRLPESWLPPRLVLTSPPYVGIHVLYHRWQVQGRRETPAPYWLAGCQDGEAGPHYSFAERRRRIDDYLEKLRSCFRSIVDIIGEQSVVVQLVAFSDPDTQLEPYSQLRFGPSGYRKPESVVSRVPSSGSGGSSQTENGTPV